MVPVVQEEIPARRHPGREPAQTFKRALLEIGIERDEGEGLPFQPRRRLGEASCADDGFLRVWQAAQHRLRRGDLMRGGEPLGRGLGGIKAREGVEQIQRPRRLQGVHRGGKLPAKGAELRHRAGHGVKLAADRLQRFEPHPVARGGMRAVIPERRAHERLLTPQTVDKGAAQGRARRVIGAVAVAQLHVMLQIQHLLRRQRKGRRVLRRDDQKIDRALRERRDGDDGSAEKGSARRGRFHEGRDVRRRERLAHQLPRAAARAVNIEFHAKPSFV